MAYLQLLRPAQWVKNIFVFAGLVFGWKLSDPNAVVLAVLAFVCFCFVASACYIINDVIDRQQDLLHPSKRNRPIARGAVSPGAAGLVAALLVAAAGLISTLGLPRAFAAVLAAYLLLILAYSFFLKQRMILDVIAISIGFVLRALGGAVAVEVAVSQWLIVCTFTLCLFLGFGKRRCELAVMANNAQAARHRRTLEGYTLELLNHLLSISAGIAVVTFMLYTMESSRPEPPFPKWMLIYTVPLVIYGLFRYAMLIESGRVTGPTDIIINDRPLLATVVLWLIMSGLIIYRGGRIAEVLNLSGPSGRTAEAAGGDQMRLSTLPAGRVGGRRLANSGLFASRGFTDVAATAGRLHDPGGDLRLDESLARGIGVGAGPAEARVLWRPADVDDLSLPAALRMQSDQAGGVLECPVDGAQGSGAGGEHLVVAGVVHVGPALDVPQRLAHVVVVRQAGAEQNEVVDHQPVGQSFDGPDGDARPC